MKALIFFTILICLNTSAYPYQAEVENISNRDYFQPVLNVINSSKESITMGMYIISLPPGQDTGGVKQLLSALVSAKKRGVIVKVILEYHGLEDFTPKGLRYHAYHYLKDNGIEVYFDESSTNCLHLKTIVIDKEIVITGSSNWSEAAFKASYETNLIVRSKPLAISILKNLEEIPTRKEPPEVITDSFNIPNSFCNSSFGALRRIVRADDLRSLDLILILWNEARDIYLCKFIAEKLRITEKMDRIGWRRQVKKTLKKLEERYKLIKYEWQFGKDEIAIELLSYPGDAPAKFPKAYFKYNWGTRLSLAGRAVLITLYVELGSLSGNVTNLPISYLRKKYGMAVRTYSKGIQELRRFNIIKVQYGRGYKDRDDTKINILGVYDMEDYNKKINGLKMQYGEGQINEALELAGIIYSIYDFNIIRDILEKMGMYGTSLVKEAFGYVKNMTADNSKRSYSYVLGILRRIQ